MGDVYPTVRLAAAQAASVWLNREATVQKACSLIEEAGRNGAQIVAFPEGYLPGFPDWFNWYMPRSPESIHFSKELIKNAIEVPSPATEELCAAARRAGVYVVMGMNERDPGAMGSLYNALLFIDPEGEILGVHRKIVPTSTERLIHWFGDGTSLRTYETPHGALGGLICGENTNSLARFALLAQQERVHVAAWPAFAIRQQRTSHEGIDIRVRYHAFEGRIFVISAASVLTDDYMDALGLTAAQREELAFRGGHSGIVGPSGNYIAGPVDDTEQIVYADADMEDVIEGKLTHDLTGHYNRFDLFTLLMKQAPREALRIEKENDSDGFEAEAALVRIRAASRDAQSQAVAGAAQRPAGEGEGT